MNANATQNNSRRWHIRIGLAIVVVGLFLCVLGMYPGLFRLDQSPVIGYVQIAVFLLGLGLVCLGGYIAVNALWNGGQKTIPADIGWRLVATGFVFCVAAGMADMIGIAPQSFPRVTPHFGRLQIGGVILGEVIILLGFLLLNPHYKRGSPQKGAAD